jgi:uncharacterized protein DUF6636
MTTVARVVLVPAALWMLFALVLPAAAQPPMPIVKTGFLTPSGNIDCNAGPADGRPVVVCTVFSEASRTRGQKVWAIRPTGRAVAGYVLGNAATDLPQLRYGRSWSWRGVECHSARAGLTCTNRDRHGFFLSRESQRVF